MAQKNDTPILIAALAITTGLLGVGGWWFWNQAKSDNNFSLPGLSAGGSNGGDSRSTAIVESVATFSDVSEVPSGLFNYGGSTTWAPIRRDIDPLIAQAYPDFQLRYTDPPAGVPGSGTGIQMLLDNQLAFAQSSRSLKPEEIQAAQDRGFSLAEVPVALEGIAIAVNPNLAVDGITIDQLRDIYTGQITNWSQVGGPSVPITPYTRPAEAGGTVDFFVNTILTGGSFGNNVKLIDTTTLALRAVSTDPGGIYYASAPEVVDQCSVKPIAIGQKPDELIPLHQLPLVPADQCPNQRNQIDSAVLLDGSYPITRRLLVIVKQNGQADQLAGEAYSALILSQEAQDLLGGSGFVRIR